MEILKGAYGDEFIAHRCRNGRWRAYSTGVCSGCLPKECIDVIFKSEAAFKEILKQEKEKKK